MSPPQKKAWTSPEMLSFASTQEATVYYREHGTPDHVATVKALADEVQGESENDSPKQQ